MHTLVDPNDPVIQLSFNNPLNTSVQLGDIAYFANTTAVGGSGLQHAQIPDYLNDAPPPHETAGQQDIIKIGVIVEIQQFDETLSPPSFIRCSVPQELFNQYFGQITGVECTISFEQTSICANKTFVSYNELLNNSTGFVDKLQLGSNFWFGNIGPSYEGPRVYKYAGHGQSSSFPNNPGSLFMNLAGQRAGEFFAMILHWFWDNPNGQNLTFSDYVFEHWTGVPYIQYKYYIFSGGGVQNHVGFDNVSEIIDFWRSEYIAWNSVPPPNYDKYFPWSLNYNNQPQTQNFTNIVQGCSFDTWYNRDPRPMNVLTHQVNPATEVCNDFTTNCDPGSFIMFSKDNKANQSDLLGYYSLVEYRNNSKTEAELYNVGASFYESSK